MANLTADDVVHAWKDEQFRNSLPEEVRSALPAAPENAGMMSDEELKLAAGGLFGIDFSFLNNNRVEVNNCGG